MKKFEFIKMKLIIVKVGKFIMSKNKIAAT